MNGGVSTRALELDPDIARMERRWSESGVPRLYDSGIGPVCRERYRTLRALLYPTPCLPVGRVEEVQITGSGRHTIPARVIWPYRGHDDLLPPDGLLVFFHGGGWMVGDLDTHHGHAVRIANSANLVVLNVDYRLSPEHPFPAAVEDAVDAVQWAADNSHLREAGAKPFLVVGGDSAGGNLAAVAAVHCAEMGLALDAQLLLYPVTDLRTTRDLNSSRAYLGACPEIAANDWQASPVLAPIPGKLAPAVLAVGRHDGLHDENMAYAEKLRDAGVDLHLHVFPRLNHGFFSYTAISRESEVAAEATITSLVQLLARRRLPA